MSGHIEFWDAATKMKIGGMDAGKAVSSISLFDDAKDIVIGFGNPFEAVGFAPNHGTIIIQSTKDWIQKKNE